MSSTSNYFKGAILANSQGYNGQSVDKYISNLKVSEMINNTNSSKTMGELFKELYNIPKANDYLETIIYSKDKFNKPV
ncbi:hypothetical protein [Mesoplasma melaleucae]|uniref:hypothetical protein n=1 Tax=Mesoplasma melaleucae TaxID=81459 RepID=UPI000482A5D8|nr:hypothetical protein [Mesoplasma melaleucae]